jgi:hypothetical protein
MDIGEVFIFLHIACGSIALLTAALAFLWLWIVHKSPNLQF